MPYQCDSQILAPVAKMLPPAAMDAFVDAANAAADLGGNHMACVSAAWLAVMEDGWAKRDGTWVKGEPGSADVHATAPTGGKPKKGPGERADCTMKAEIIKSDDEQRIVWGWASVISEGGEPVVDGQNDTIDADELMKATTEFMKDIRAAMEMHERNADGSISPDLYRGTVVHSFPLTAELAKAFGISCDREGWLVGVHIADDDVWAGIKAGKYTAFSIGGSARRVEV